MFRVGDEIVLAWDRSKSGVILSLSAGRRKAGECFAVVQMADGKQRRFSSRSIRSAKTLEPSGSSKPKYIEMLRSLRSRRGWSSRQSLAAAKEWGISLRDLYEAVCE